jgi:5-formyltetrahydrofolate cyclo-ligase
VTDRTKGELRRELLAARRAMTDQDRRDQDVLVRATATALLAQTGNDVANGAAATRGSGHDRSAVHVRPTVAAYRPMIGEPGGAELPATLATQASRVLLPVVLGDRDLDWALFDPDDPDGGLAPAGLGLHEPTGARLGVDAISAAAIVFVPALAVDRRGGRLGRGGGSFDRALARVRPPQLVIALLYAGEFRLAVPVESHDRAVDGVITGGEVTIFHGM